ncbi:MAG: D-alanyl-D-alanine carboxypeptidase [Lachnospiraceae bacterium]|nr:D-alanyl-D-alanine carboxypeptidase [Lachnospiraceae bacterium]
MEGCSVYSYKVPYEYNFKQSEYNMEAATSNDRAKPFADDICVADTGNTDIGPALNGIEAAGIFDIDNCEAVYVKNIHNKLYPASITKIMTALIALKYGNPDDIITVSSNVEIVESGATLLGLKEGDRLTLEQALNGLLIYSGNDAGVAIAEYISGNVEAFTALMNKEALALGATNTNFINPHGLSDDSHYSSAYDLYLIFNEAVKYDKFREIIGKREYSTTYSDRDGKSKEMTITNTNLYLTGEKTGPDKVTVVGGKTGTTNQAGSCLILLSEDQNSHPYISVILNAQDKELLYRGMSQLLDQVP